MSNNDDNGDGPRVIVIELPPKEKLGVKLMPPKSGVIDHGLSIDNIDNPLLENKVQAGDLIVAIGGRDVDQMGFSDAIDLIRKLPRPLAISFEIDELRREEVRREKTRKEDDIEELDKELTTYAVVFEEGPMGLNLEEAVRYGIDGAVVRALKGQAKTNGMISIGDIVYKVGEVEVLCMPYAEVMDVIRKTPSPKTLQFVPKDKLADVQRVTSRHSESFKMRSSSISAKKFISSARMPKLDNNESDDQKSIAQLILDNQNATIKKGRMYKQGRVMRNWKSRYFVLSVSKIEYFKNPSSTTSRGELSFLNMRCTVRSLPASSEIVCKSPQVVAEYQLELRVGDRRLVMACTSEADKKGWMDAIKLAIDASKTVGTMQSAGDSLNVIGRLRKQRTGSMSAETFLDRNANGRLSQFNYDSFPTPVIHVTVLSATNLAKAGSNVNAVCEVTLGSETFKTNVVKNQRSPVWKQDNSATFEAESEEMVLEIRLFDEHVFRSSELLASLTIPLKSLPNMQKATKKYPLALASRSAGAVINLALEYVNKAKAYHEDQERMRLDDDIGQMNDRDRMRQIQTEAQKAADLATENAKYAEEEARNLLEQARKKAEAAMAAAREEQEQGKAAVEAAMAEAAKAKEEAEKQAAEARRAQEEARKLIEANRRIQEGSVQVEQMEGVTSQFGPYRNLVLDGMSHDDVKAKMREEGIDESSIAAFFDGIRSYDEKIRQLQDELKKLKSSRSKPREEPKPVDPFANLDISTDQVKLLRRLLKLEKQLQAAGIAVAADIPYEEAKEKVEEIGRRMQEIGSADVTHPDPEIQRQLREEYFRLEQDMEKYNTALMLTDEYAAEEARKEREWEEDNYEENMKALKAIRRMMPVAVKNMSEQELQTKPSPTGKTIPLDVARKFKRTNVLELLRMNPLDIVRTHPSSLENLRVTGLTVTERRALHMHLKDIAETWKAQQNEEMTKRKFDWFKTLKETFKTVVNSYNRHVAQYGPADNHPYATRDDPGIGCPLLGKQCPIKADKTPNYSFDLGHPDGDVYMQSSVQKSDAEDAGAKALAEAKEMMAKKRAGARSETLKKHYKNQVRLVAEANGVCEAIDAMLDQIEGKQLQWFQTRLKHRLNKSESAATIKLEIADFSELVKDIRLAATKFAERSGMNLRGKRSAANDSPDTRSSIECDLANMLCDAVVDCFEGIQERLDEVQANDKRLTSALPDTKSLLVELKDRGTETLAKLNDKVQATRKLKTRAEILKEAKEKNASEMSGSAAPAEAESSGGGERAPHPMMAARGRGGRGGRGGLFAAIKGRGGGGDDEEGGGGGGGGNDLFSAIRARGRGGAGPGRGDLFSAIKGRGGGGGDEDGGGRGGGGDLFAAIRARGRGSGGAPGGGRGDLFAAIKSRQKE
ncbi:hypothetical protein Poli38472_006648 [Pythium oligandrum]|uniref:PH domain-containing protein n=1 Tax=Pythium oligandrum TaxID=41045 RepID=A0A8K1FFB7_PYTOL|nr:hypothetical protein Poli38472_006648 [Pythium oligandrum]|eukprot:TMW56638.1 hypothetical protein Poli38472_006648 [Pythium oligandrum]